MIIKEEVNNELIVCYDKNKKGYRNKFTLFCQDKELLMNVIKDLKDFEVNSYFSAFLRTFPNKIKDFIKINTFWYKEIIPNDIDKYIDDYKIAIDKIARHHSLKYKFFTDINYTYEYIKTIK